MPTGAVTKRAVDALKPGKGDVFLWDTDVPGFGVRLTPGGVLSYVYQYRLGGRGTRARRTTIGRHGPITPDQARGLARKLAHKVLQGIDPVAEEQQRKHLAATLSFPAYVETFTEHYLKTEWGASWGQVRRQLDMHVVPLLAEKALPAITPADLNAVFDRLRDRPALQRQVFAAVRRLFNFAVKRDDLATSPLMKMDTPKGVPSRKRVLSADELVALWRATYKLDEVRGPFVRLLIATLQRRSEVADLPYSELARAEALWRLPGERSKNGEEHLVPLSPLAVAVFEERGWKPRGFVFPSSTGKTPISNFSDVKAVLDREMPAILQQIIDEHADAAGEDRHAVEIKPWRLHDIRRTGTTRMQGLGVPIETTERVINHHEAGEARGIRGVYNLWEYLDEKRRALDAWGVWLQQQIDGAPASSNVVQLVTRRA